MSEKSRTFELRWKPARNMWQDGVPASKIAEYYEITLKAFKQRIQKWRKNSETKDWFPPRNHKCELM